MLSFYYEKSISEVIEIINIRELDKDIRNYIIELKEDDELKSDIQEYFDLTCLSDNENEVYIRVGCYIDKREYDKMSKDEKLLHDTFQSRVLFIYENIKQTKVY